MLMGRSVPWRDPARATLPDREPRSAEEITMKIHVVVRAVLAAVLLAALPQVAAAQSPKNEQAKKLFEQGRDHMKAGRAQEACEALEQSVALEQAINSHYQLGKCYEAQGRYATAHAAYLRAATMARTAGDNQRFDAAQKASDELKAKVASVVVVVPLEGRPAGLTIKRDGQTIGEDDWGKALPVDSGSHTITAEATGFERWTETVTAASTGGVTRVAVPALQPTQAQPGTGTAPPPEAPPDPNAPTERRSGAGFGIGIALICLGGVAILAAPVGIGVTSSNCPSCGYGPFIGVGVVGLAALGAGIPLTVVFGQRVPVEPPKAAVQLTPWIGPTGGGLRLDF
jgi:hypothetical protein